MRLFFYSMALRNTRPSTVHQPRTVAQIRDNLPHGTLNSGNIVHREALHRLLKHDDPAEMGEVDLAGIDADNMGDANIDPHYDAIVVQKSNLIRSYDHLAENAQAKLFRTLSQEAEWLIKTRLRIFVFGVGIQDLLPSRPDAIPMPLFDLLKVYNDRAEIFAVRGEATAEWLHSVGLTRAVALGCPSLFLNPSATVTVSAPPIDSKIRLGSAGHLQKNAFPHRLIPINRIGTRFRTSYVFQNDFFAFFRRHGELKVYDEHTGAVDSETVRELARKSIGVDLSFEDYFLFFDTDLWRDFASARDVYFGDRFHGGVIFLQCGKPVVLVCNDARVSELADFMAIPVVQSAELMEGDPIDVLKSILCEQNLARFRMKYLERLRAFREAISAVRLELTNDSEFAEALGQE